MTLKRLLHATLFLLAANPCHAETLTNDSVITLVKSGFSNGLIIDKINSASCNYDVSVEKIIQLKNTGVPDEVVAAMVRRCASLDEVRGVAGDDTSNDPTVKHSPGIYAFDDWDTPKSLTAMRPSKPSGERTTGNGSLLFPLKSKLVMPGLKSHIDMATSAPTFYFYFNPSDEKVSDFGMENSIAAQSPEEFSLIKFTPHKDSREITVGRLSPTMFGINMKRGIDPKYTIPFDSKEIKKGIFKVTPVNKLESGEYAFAFTGANGFSRVYDFTVK